MQFTARELLVEIMEVIQFFQLLHQQVVVLVLLEPVVMVDPVGAVVTIINQVEVVILLL